MRNHRTEVDHPTQGPSDSEVVLTSEPQTSGQHPPQRADQLPVPLQMLPADVLGAELTDEAIEDLEEPYNSPRSNAQVDFAQWRGWGYGSQDLGAGAAYTCHLLGYESLEVRLDHPVYGVLVEGAAVEIQGFVDSLWSPARAADTHSIACVAVYRLKAREAGLCLQEQA